MCLIPHAPMLLTVLPLLEIHLLSRDSSPDLTNQLESLGGSAGMWREGGKRLVSRTRAF